MIRFIIYDEEEEKKANQIAHVNQDKLVHHSLSLVVVIYSRFILVK